MNISRIVQQYYVACIVVGGLQFFDGLSFALQLNGPINEAYSYIEILWFTISIIFLFVLHNKGRNVFLPLTYVTYIIVNIWFAHNVFKPIDISPGYQIPLWFSFVTMSFALLLARLAIVAYKKH